jgi:ParB family chromosome partitioning protein
MAEKVGKKRSTVSNYMRLLNLPNEVQLALKEGLITMGHAKAIAGIDAEKQVWALKKCLKKALSVRQAEELARKLAEQGDTTPALEEEYPESYSRLVEKLERLFSENISIKRSKNGGGKIVIDFTSDEEIDTFIERLHNR